MSHAAAPNATLQQADGGEATGPGPSSSNVFDAKIDKTSSDMYFHYYGMLQHQQNMLQVRRSRPVQEARGPVPLRLAAAELRPYYLGLPHRPCARGGRWL
jgi:hypothetical protein